MFRKAAVQFQETLNSNNGKLMMKQLVLHAVMHDITSFKTAVNVQPCCQMVGKQDVVLAAGMPMS